MITIESSGSFQNTEKFLHRMKDSDLMTALGKYGVEGVQALSQATPQDSGLTASSWSYEILKQNGNYTIVWINTNVHSGVSVAVLIQYGHGTGTGGYVQGRDYINPAIQPIFDRIANDVWKVVTTS